MKGTMKCLIPKKIIVLLRSPGYHPASGKMAAMYSGEIAANMTEKMKVSYANGITRDGMERNND